MSCHAFWRAFSGLILSGAPSPPFRPAFVFEPDSFTTSSHLRRSRPSPATSALGYLLIEPASQRRPTEPALRLQEEEAQAQIIITEGLEGLQRNVGSSRNVLRPWDHQNWIFSRYHDDSLAGHFGFKKILGRDFDLQLLSTSAHCWKDLTKMVHYELLQITINASQGSVFTSKFWSWRLSTASSDQQSKPNFEPSPISGRIIGLYFFKHYTLGGARVQEGSR